MIGALPGGLSGLILNLLLLLISEAEVDPDSLEALCSFDSGDDIGECSSDSSPRDGDWEADCSIAIESTKADR